MSHPRSLRRGLLPVAVAALCLIAQAVGMTPVGATTTAGPAYEWDREDAAGLSPDTQAIDPRGDPEAFSQTWPRDAAVITGRAVYLAWEPSVGADEYWYCYDDSGVDSFDCLGPVATTGALFGPLDPDATYHWMVVAMNDSGSTNAGIWSFRVVPEAGIASWGYNIDGEVSDTPAASIFVAVHARHRHSLALRADGSLAAWGRDDYGQVSGAPAGSIFVAVAAGGEHSVALREDGSL
ncbi:MAG: hypothetical protein JW785_10700, partial [Acidimicrobiia bacterium]|nr:hypothetical protein [Acidimicrobiia bacterium]